MLSITAEILIKMWYVLKSGFMGPIEDLVIEMAFLSISKILRISIGDIQLYIHDIILQLNIPKTDPFCKGVNLKYLATEQNICPFQTTMTLLQTRTDKVAQSQDPLFTTSTWAPIYPLFRNRIKDATFNAWLLSIFV